MLPFWTKYSRKLAGRFPLPTKTGYKESKVRDKAWFRASQWTSTQPHINQSSLLRTIIDNVIQENDNLPLPTQATKRFKPQKETKPPPERTKKIRLYPTDKQRDILNQWFGTARWTYNQCIDAIENRQMKRNKKELRSYCGKANASQVMGKAWVLDTPAAIRDEALCDVLKAYNTSFALLKMKTQKHFKMKFQKRKALSQSIVIRHQNWKDTKKIFWAAAFRKRGAETSLLSSEPLPDTIDYDCRLQRTRLGHFYFCLLLPKDGQRSDNQAPLKDPCILAIDPGVRTFLTGYNPMTGSYIEWGKGDMNRLVRLGEHLDVLISRTVKERSWWKRQRMQKAQWRIRLKIRNLVDEFHKQLVHWLVNHYELILLPEFAVSNMVNKQFRKIGRPSVRAMLTWSFYRFKQRLLMKAKQSNDKCLVVIVDEHHTTMTCGECGNLNRLIKDEKVLRCPFCLTTIPRDWNAARNIFIRFVTTSAWSRELRV